MAPSKTDSEPSQSHYYTPMLCSHHHQTHLVIPFCLPENLRLRWRTIILTLLLLLLLTALVYFFWPSEPTLKIVRLKLKKIHVHTRPFIYIDISLHATIMVRNVDAYSMDFTSIYVRIKYRGKRLGYVKAHGGHVKALTSSYVEAELELTRVRILSDVVYLLEDLSKGRIPFHTETEVTGTLGFLLFGLPLKTKLLCEVVINTTNQTIERQNCYTKSLVRDAAEAKRFRWCPYIERSLY
ncbi:hypothetical protein K2173_024726 [Erythroxylum novogranatense]|uniref:Late embryogenesis abundant protein LEA-2 subgroup domain-containing protein n=1 Tax=Erythroxylum novogranatense TaxID=1862640 RepID=A0AAV8SWF4_9ROSI|nr:hypothetical protein K2173_024726 [Erythroxylum novogranatense]